MRIGRKQPTHGSSTLQSDSGKMRPPERQRGRWQRISPAKVWLRTTSWRSNRAQRWDAGASCEFESISNRNCPARNYPALGSLSCVAYSGSEWLCGHCRRRRFRLFESISISPPTHSPSQKIEFWVVDGPPAPYWSSSDSNRSGGLADGLL